MATLGHAETYALNVQFGIAQRNVDQKCSIAGSFCFSHEREGAMARVMIVHPSFPEQPAGGGVQGIEVGIHVAEKEREIAGGPASGENRGTHRSLCLKRPTDTSGGGVQGMDDAARAAHEDIAARDGRRRERRNVALRSRRTTSASGFGPSRRTNCAMASGWNRVLDGETPQPFQWGRARAAFSANADAPQAAEDAGFPPGAVEPRKAATASNMAPKLSERRIRAEDMRDRVARAGIWGRSSSWQTAQCRL
jgi:hypothetical protein